MKKLILASASPRRASLLRLLDIPFEIAPSNANEALDTILPPAEHVREIAQRKTKAVVHRFDHALVLGADTIVALEDAIFEKPNDAKHAADMLAQLSGKTHQVYTGLALTDTETGQTLTEVATTHVTMRVLSSEDIATLCRHWGFYGQSRCLRRAGARLCIYTIYIRLLLQCGGFAACVLLEPLSPSGRAIALGDHTRK
ncbi:dTTP/UTP pyrophosphatase [Geodia barretti]|uniref:dTTP/UTP pyrophosphatase n=1 Tax=Geodia barretti TaxID=519541 RepID=A0AA35W8T7_GEOBA|nr:dTTP/UTP pyrophosphatase [Geodia barretti]